MDYFVQNVRLEVFDNVVMVTKLYNTKQAPYIFTYAYIHIHAHTHTHTYIQIHTSTYTYVHPHEQKVNG